MCFSALPQFATPIVRENPSRRSYARRDRLDPVRDVCGFIKR
jgi:hypothetical protein